MKEKFKNIFEKEKISRAFLLYTLIFFVCALFMSYVFYHNGKLFIWGSDGIEQHILNLRLYRDLLLNYFKTGNFQTFYWNIGLGFDLFSNFSYYVFGDFISYFSIIFPETKLNLFYCLAVIVRLYFVGISFIIYAKYKKISNNSSVIGAIIYTFCMWSLFSAVRHPYFVNAMILFPLLMLGIEKIVNENKKVFFVIIVFLSFLSSFYFAFMLSMCIVVYGSILIFSKYHKLGFKVILSIYLKVLFYSVIGILLSSFVLVPTIQQFFTSARSIRDASFVYTNNYYVKLLSSLVTYSSSNWVFLAMNGISLFVIPMALKHYKENIKILLFIALLFIPLLIPSIGSIFCGFSFPNNRWSFIIPFLIAFLTCTTLDKYINNLSKNDIKFILIFNIIYLGLIFFTLDNIPEEILFPFIVLLITIFIILNKNNLEKVLKKVNFFNVVLLFFVTVETLIFINHFYINNNNYIEEFVDRGKVNYNYATNLKTIGRFEQAIEKIKKSDDSFYRIGKYPYLMPNSSLYYDYNSINYFYSIIPDKVSELGYDLSNWQYHTNTDIKEFDYRTKILSLLGTKYIVSNNDKYIPYGYSLYDEEGKTLIFKNDHTVNFGVLYDDYIDIDEYDELSGIEKENSLLKTVALNKEDINDEFISKREDLRKDLDKEIVYLDYDISKDEKKFKFISERDKNIDIDIEEDDDLEGELYLKIDNLQYRALSKKELYDLKVNIGETLPSIFKREYRLYEPVNNFSLKVKYGEIVNSQGVNDLKFSAYSTGSNDKLVKLGKYDKNNKTIKIKFNNDGTYSYDKLEVLVVKFDKYDKDIDDLNKSNFEVDKFDKGYMKAKVNAEKKGILQFSTTYSKGWDIYVDGKKAKALNVNKYFLGTYIEKGKHEIELKYHTPYLNIGFIMSGCGLLAFVGIVVFEFRKSDRSNGKGQKRKRSI